MTHPSVPLRVRVVLSLSSFVKSVAPKNIRGAQHAPITKVFFTPQDPQAEHQRPASQRRAIASGAFELVEGGRELTLRDRELRLSNLLSKRSPAVAAVQRARVPSLPSGCRGRQATGIEFRRGFREPDPKRDVSGSARRSDSRRRVTGLQLRERERGHRLRHGCVESIVGALGARVHALVFRWRPSGALSLGPCDKQASLR